MYGILQAFAWKHCIIPRKIAGCQVSESGFDSRTSPIQNKRASTSSTTTSCIYGFLTRLSVPPYEVDFRMTGKDEWGRFRWEAIVAWSSYHTLVCVEKLNKTTASPTIVVIRSEILNKHLPNKSLKLDIHTSRGFKKVKGSDRQAS
jgi:hypothetical protein